jgi:hydroxymethylbilane synthase
MAAIRLGTRGSALAVAQSTMVARSIEQLGATVELVTITTSGDQPSDGGSASTRGVAAASDGGAALAADGDGGRGVDDKSRFVKEIEQALLAGEIDLAVHSAKDVPGELPDGLEIVAVPERADPRDALCGTDSLDALAEGAVVGTASLRRRAQLLALRPDLDIRELRGNVDTRLRRLAEGSYDAIVLAAAGLERLALAAAGPERVASAAAGPQRVALASVGRPLALDALTPAPGQGCLALEARSDDDATRRLASRLTDPHAFARLTAERTVVTAIDATCHTPVGAHATIENHTVMRLRTFVGTPDGATWIRDEVRGLADEPQVIGLEAANRLIAAGAPAILAEAAGNRPRSRPLPSTAQGRTERRR